MAFIVHFGMTFDIDKIKKIKSQKTFNSIFQNETTDHL